MNTKRDETTDIVVVPCQTCHSICNKYDIKMYRGDVDVYPNKLAGSWARWGVIQT